MAKSDGEQDNNSLSLNVPHQKASLKIGARLKSIITTTRSLISRLRIRKMENLDTPF